MDQRSKKTIAGLFGLFFLIASIGISLIVVKQRQNVRKNASEPGTTNEEVTVSLFPTSKTLRVGESAETTIRIDTGSIAVSAVSIHLTYIHTTQTPDLTISDLTLVSTQTEWNCPVKTIAEEATSTHIELGCLTTSPNGYASLGVVDFASFTIAANSAPPVNPIIFRFDPNQSLVSRKSDNQDLLLTPISTGEYTITAGDPGISSPTPTITPIGVGGTNPSVTPTISPTSLPNGTTPTTTLTPIATRTPSPTIAAIAPTNSPTPHPSLPVTGNPSGTIGGFLTGILVIIVGAALFF